MIFSLFSSLEAPDSATPRFMVVWGFEDGGFELVLGLGFVVYRVLDLWCQASWVFLGGGALFVNITE